MQLISYQQNDLEKIGAVVNGRIIDLHAVDNNIPQTMVALLALGDEGMALVKTAVSHHSGTVALEDVALLPPVVRPGKVIALGRNYAAHAAEGGAKVPDFPMLFHKTHTSLIGHNGTIIIPPVTEKVDYECELAVIIGKTCKQVSEAEALDYVAGYTAANDVSARDLQRRTSQFTSGKMIDTFGPLGPTLVTADELPDPSNLKIRTILNGTVLQDDTTSNMIFNVPFTISYISQITTLEPGDVILTGTPEGVGFARTPPVWLKDGDTISIEIEGVGVLTNSVKAQ